MQGCFPGGPVVQLCARWDAPWQPKAPAAAQSQHDMRGRLYVLINPVKNPGKSTMLGASDAIGKPWQDIMLQAAQFCAGLEM